MDNVTVVGCGAIGLKTAIELKKNGFEVNAIEEHALIGEPSNCSGLISKSGIEELGIDLSQCLLQKINGAKIFAPNGSFIEIRKRETVAYVVDRTKFDQTFYNEAKKLGIDVRLNTRLIDVRNNNLFVQSSNHGEIMKSNIIVGADGVNSTVRKVMAIPVQKQNFVQTAKATIHGNFEENMVELHLGSTAPGFFAWIVPHNPKEAEVGLGTTLGINPNVCLNNFLQKINHSGEIADRKNFMIPACQPMQKCVEKNFLLVGDSAFQTKSTTGGGLVIGLNCAKICARTIVEHLKNKKPLAEYDKNLKEINAELKIHWKIRNYANNLNDGKIIQLIEKAKKAGIEEFLEEHGNMDYPGKFIGKVMANPKLWFLAPTALAIMGK